MTVMVLTCIAMVGALFLLLGRSSGSLGLLWLVVLLCPLFHLLMHRRHREH